MLNKIIIGSSIVLSAFGVFGLEIKEAKFGIADKWADVSVEFKKLKVNDNLYAGLTDGIRMAGKDPAPGVAKKLVVKYKDNDGQEKIVSFDEKAFSAIAADTPVSQEFKLGSAWFGDQGKFLNITDKMRDLIKNNNETVLDFPTLGIDGKNDPLPGKRKMVLLFYALDGKQYCRQFWENDKFKGSFVSGIFDPIPQAKKAQSPFRGMELDKAIWQWAMPVKGVISGENNLPPVAYLYIPPKTKHVRAVIIGQFNMLEQPILEHPKFREALQRLDYAAIWIAPMLYGPGTDYTDSQKFKMVETMLADFAALSGYRELDTAPLIGIGHSALSGFPWDFAIGKPERILTGISYDGSFAGNKVEKLKGIPMLTRNGEYSWASGNTGGVKLREAHPELAVSMVADPGSGHFDINDEIIEFIGYYLEKADKARNSDDGKLKPVDPASGWLVDRWRGDREPTAQAAPYAQFTGKEGIWVFDEEHARKLEEYQARFRGKKVELIGYMQNGKVLNDLKSHAQIHPRFIPEADGLSIKLKAVFLDKVPAGRAERWSGKKADSPIAHGTDVENIHIYPICGPVVRIDNETVAVRFNRFGLTSSRRTGEIYMIAVYPGDSVYRRIIQQSTMNIPRSNDKGIAQRIDFPVIPDQKSSVKSIKLNARVNTGMPVEYYVEYGPAYLKDGELILTDIPAGARYPVEVSVVAWQYGNSGSPQLQSALPVNRKFKITNQ